MHLFGLYGAGVSCRMHLFGLLWFNLVLKGVCIGLKRGAPARRNVNETSMETNNITHVQGKKEQLIYTQVLMARVGFMELSRTSTYMYGS